MISRAGAAPVYTDSAYTRLLERLDNMKNEETFTELLDLDAEGVARTYQHALAHWRRCLQRGALDKSLIGQTCSQHNGTHRLTRALGARE